MKNTKHLAVVAVSVALVGVAQAADIVQPVAVAVAPPAPASVAAIPPAALYLSLYGGWGEYTQADGPTSGSFGLVGGDARSSIWFSPAFSVQGDAEAEWSSAGFSDCCVSTDHRLQGVVGAHLSWRDSLHLLGVFGGLASATNFDAEGEVLQGIVGAEAQMYVGNFTFYDQAGYTWNTGSTSFGQNLWFVRGVGRYFLTPNDKLQAEVGYAAGRFTGDSDLSATWNWGASYEHRFPGPLSGFVEYAGFTNSNRSGDGYRATENQVMGGVRINFGTGTLLQNDRNGATLDMPKIVRPFAWSYYDY